ncbi:DNA recombination and repair protein RecO [Planctomycetales bacterium 10988]|nr:DNA recombination and repair protein RecO [Planctomycetales bacterium 10988]
MPSEKSAAIVIRVIDWSESSNVVTLFTRDFGKITALAKGGRRPKGPFESALDLLAGCRIVFLHKSTEALDLLTEAKLMRRFRGAEQGLAPLYAGYYLAELLRELTEEGDPHPELFDASEEIIQVLSSTKAPVARLVLQFEIIALRLLGHLPRLTHCVETGVPVTASGTVAFGILSGGVLSPEVAQQRSRVTRVRNSSLKIIEQFAQDVNAWKTITLDSQSLGELRNLFNQYIQHLLGKKPRMHDHLRLLSQQ